MFHCPISNDELKPERTVHGTAWTCPACGGRALGTAVLSGLAGQAAVGPYWRRARESGRPSELHCPSCHNPMVGVPPAHAADKESHVCLSCAFAWMPLENYQRVAGSQASAPAPALAPSAQEAIVSMQLQMQRSQVESEYGPDTPYGWKRLAAMFGFPVSDEEHGAHEQGAGLVWPLAAVVAVTSFWGFSDVYGAAHSLGFIPEKWARYAGLTWVTPFFVHGGFMHLVGNLYFLVLFDKRVEYALGAARNLLLLLAATIAGNLAHLMLDPRPEIPCVGASGGISGAMVYYALRFRGDRFWFWWSGHWIRLPAIAFIGIWILLQVKSAFAQHWGLSSVSAYAHLGGALVGFAFWLKWGRPASGDAA